VIAKWIRLIVSFWFGLGWRETGKTKRNMNVQGVELHGRVELWEVEKAVIYILSKKWTQSAKGRVEGWLLYKGKMICGSFCQLCIGNIPLSVGPRARSIRICPRMHTSSGYDHPTYTWGEQGQLEVNRFSSLCVTPYTMHRWC
jgi:hypothetical protein